MAEVGLVAQKERRLIALTDFMKKVYADGIGRIGDVALAQETAFRIKPHIDRLKNWERASELTRRAVTDIEEIDRLEDSLKKDLVRVERFRIEGSLADGMQQRLADIKKRLESARPEISRTESLRDLTPQEQAELIFGRRSIDVETTARILGLKIDASEETKYYEKLDELFSSLFGRSVSTGDDVKPLREKFSRYILVFRSSYIGAEAKDNGILLCNMANLKKRFPNRFRHGVRESTWYDDLSFFTEMIDTSHWAVLDTRGLGCSFRKADRRLAAYAKRNGFDQEMVQQKRAVEEVYDRVIIGEALKINPFGTRYASCTRSTYRREGDKRDRRVHIHQDQEDGEIGIYSVRGGPRWDRARRCWPVVYPSVSPVH